MSVKFKCIELKEEFINVINTINVYNTGYEYLKIDDIYEDELSNVNEYFQKVKCVGYEYTEEECEELGYELDSQDKVIDNDIVINLSIDEYESEVECTLKEFIDIVKVALNSTITEDGICISEREIIIRVEIKDIENPYVYENFPYFNVNFLYKDHEVNVSIEDKNSIYIMKNYFDGNYDENYPLTLIDELFMKIQVNDDYILCEKEIYEIFNVCAYEIFKKCNYKLNITPRQLGYFDEDDIDDDIDDDIYEIDEKLFSNGLSEILDIFNNAEGYDNNRSIVEYVKVIEYISATVIRKKLTEEVMSELSELNDVNLISNHIERLEKIFINNNKNTKTDSDKIKETIIECCNVEKLAEYSPMYLKSLYNLRNIGNVKEANIKSAKNDLARSISNTRNNLSHAKVNYQKKDLECPDNEKEQFVVLLRNVCIQIIEWYSKADNNIRVIES